MIQPFKKFYWDEISEAKKPEKDPALIKTKNKTLNVSEVKIDLLHSETVEPMVRITYLKDPNVKGHVRYSSIEDAKTAYDNLNELGDILNFMYYNMTNVDTAHKWSYVINNEIRAERKKTKDEIEADGLNFSIVSDEERLADIDAENEIEVANATDDAPEGEPEGEPEEEPEESVLEEFVKKEKDNE
jgi:hypothetical protein